MFHKGRALSLVVGGSLDTCRGRGDEHLQQVECFYGHHTCGFMNVSASTGDSRWLCKLRTDLISHAIGGQSWPQSGR